MLRDASAELARSVIRDRTVDDSHFRVATVAVRPGFAVQAGSHLDGIDHARAGLILDFTLIAGLAVLLSGVLSARITWRAMRPVETLSIAAHDVARRRDPGLVVPESGGAELETLGVAFNTMLRSLDSARRQQQQLIDDAAHELRTPLTSMRTNIEVLAEGHVLEDNDRRELLADVRFQLDEFTNLVADIGELAQDSATSQEAEILLHECHAAIDQEADHSACE